MQCCQCLWVPQFICLRLFPPSCSRLAVPAVAIFFSFFFRSCLLFASSIYTALKMSNSVYAHMQRECERERTRVFKCVRIQGSLYSGNYFAVVKPVVLRTISLFLFFFLVLSFQIHAPHAEHTCVSIAICEVPFRLPSQSAAPVWSLSLPHSRPQFLALSFFRQFLFCPSFCPNVPI